MYEALQFIIWLYYLSYDGGGKQIFVGSQFAHPCARRDVVKTTIRPSLSQCERCFSMLRKHVFYFGMLNTSQRSDAPMRQPRDLHIHCICRSKQLTLITWVTAVLSQVRSDWLTNGALYSGVAKQSIETPPNVVNKWSVFDSRTGLFAIMSRPTQSPVS
jgi:hypothetical protein